MNVCHHSRLPFERFKRALFNGEYAPHAIKRRHINTLNSCHSLTFIFCNQNPKFRQIQETSIIESVRTIISTIIHCDQKLIVTN